MDPATNVVYFVDETNHIFDRLEFDDIDQAKEALKRNGFSPVEPGDGYFDNIAPRGPAYRVVHGHQVYSSGRFWR